MSRATAKPSPKKRAKPKAMEQAAPSRRVRSWFSGKAANVVEDFAELRNSYDAIRPGPFQRKRIGLNPMGSGADYHLTESEHLRLIEHARDVARNDSVGGTLVKRFVKSVLPECISLDFQTTDKAFNDELGWRWWNWGNDPTQCDAAEENTFAQMEKMSLRASVIDGDIIAMALNTGKLQLVEAHRVRTPGQIQTGVVLGVELGAQRQRIAYYVCDDDINPRIGTSGKNLTRYTTWGAGGVRQIFHVYQPDRVSQTRGVSGFAQVFSQIGMMDDALFARLLQQQIVACFAVIRERAVEYAGPNNPAQMGGLTTETETDGTTRVLEQIRPGMMVTGAPGDKLTGFSPQVPNPEFFPFHKTILHTIASALDVPLIALLMDASETNFSGWRGAMDIARQGYRDTQRWLVGRLHEPVLRFKLAEWAQTDRILAERLQSDDPKVNPLLAHRWQPPRWPYIQPEIEANADIVQLKGGLTSWTRKAAERGNDQEEIAIERRTDIERAIADAEEINAANPEAKVDWRELLGLEGKAAPAPMPFNKPKPSEPDDDKSDDEEDEDEDPEAEEAEKKADAA